MPHRQIIPALIGAALAGVVIGPIAFHKGQGPALRIVSIEASGPGQPGSVLPLLVDGKTRDGCIPIVARSITRLIRNHTGKIQLIKEPLTNVALVAYDPKPPADLVAKYGYDQRKIVPLFLPNSIPRVEDYGSYLVHDAAFTDEHGIHRPSGYVEPWKLQTDSSPFACGVAELLMSLYRPGVIGAHDIPIEILQPDAADKATSTDQVDLLKEIQK